MTGGLRSKKQVLVSYSGRWGNEEEKESTKTHLFQNAIMTANSLYSNLRDKETLESEIKSTVSGLCH